MGFGEIVVDLDRSQCSLFSFWHYFARREMNIRQAKISIRQPAVGQGVVGVDPNRLLENLDGLQHPFFAVSVPEITASQVEIVGFNVLGWASGETYAIAGGQFEFQTLRYGFRNLRLNRKNVRGAAIVVLAPKL